MSALDLAKRDLRTLYEKQQDLEQEIADQEDFIKRLEKYEEQASAPTVTLPVVLPTTKANGTAFTLESATLAVMTLADAAETILKAAPNPLILDELLAEMERRGRHVGGGDPKANLSSVLSRNAQFEFQKGRGWRLKQNAPPAETGGAF